MSILVEVASSIAKGVDAGRLGKISQLFGTVGEVGGEIATGISAEEQSKAIARSVLRRAAVEAGLRRREGKRLVGKQRALYAKSGVELTGTPLEIMTEAMREAEKDAMMIELQGREEAKRYRKIGRGELSSSLLGAGTTLLTRAGGLMKRKGVNLLTESVDYGVFGRSWSFPYPTFK